MSDAVVPDRSSYLGQFPCRVSVAPARAGYLVRRDDQDQLRRALLLAGSTWGGARSPLVPVEHDGSVQGGWLQVLRVLSPDMVVDLAWDGGPSLADVSAVGLPVAPAPQGQLTQLCSSATGMSPEEVRGLVVDVAPGPDVAGLAGCGGLTDDAATDWGALGAQMETAGDCLATALAQVRGSGPAALTLHRHQVRFAEVPFLTSPALLWVTDRARPTDSWQDTVRFWNDRALRPADWGGPAVLVDRQAAQEPEFQQALQEAVRDRVSADLQLFMLSTSVDKEELEGLAEALGFAPFRGGRVTEHDGRPGGADAPLTAAVDQDLSQYWTAARAYGATAHPLIQLHRPTTALRFPTPLAFHPRLLHRGRVRLGVSGPFVTGPRRSAVATLYHRDAAWGTGGESGELVLRSVPAPSYELALGVPTGGEVLTAALAAAGRPPCPATRPPTSKGS